MLTQFTQISLLRTIGESRIAKLLNHFSADLLQANIPIPNREEQNGQYLDSVVTIFRDRSRLPPRVLQTLLTIENAAASENLDRLEASFQRQPHALSLPDCVLDRALELWFVAPEELSQFEPAPSQIKNRKSKIENDLPLSSSAEESSPEERPGVRSRSPENQRIEMQQSDKGTTSKSKIKNRKSKLTCSDSATTLLRPNMQQTPANIDLLRPEPIFVPSLGEASSSIPSFHSSNIPLFHFPYFPLFPPFPAFSQLNFFCFLCALLRQKFPTPESKFQSLKCLNRLSPSHNLTLSPSPVLVLPPRVNALNRG